MFVPQILPFDTPVPSAMKGFGKGKGKDLEEPPVFSFWDCQPEYEEPADEDQAPPEHRPDWPIVEYRSLGYLKMSKHKLFKHLEYQYLTQCHEILTEHWYLVQGGFDEQAIKLWRQIFLLLELDLKAQVDLILLAQLSEGARASANELIWDLLSHHGLRTDYKDLSNLVSLKVKLLRRSFDRPPHDSLDRPKWTWKHYSQIHNEDWGHRKAPGGPCVIRTGPGDVPLPPTRCWGPSRVPPSP